MAIEYIGTKILKDNEKKDLIQISFDDCGDVIKIFLQIVFLTPQMAEKFLQKNTNNRKISPDRVKLFSNLMKRMLWFPFSTITFDTEGTLLDGQHRIASVVNSGTGAYFIIVKGIPKEWMYGIDAGRPRTFQDYSRFAGKTDRNVHLAIARFLEFGLSTTGRKKIFSVFDDFDLVDKYRDPIVFAVDHTRKVRGMTSPALYAVARAWYTMDLVRLVQFCTILKTGMVGSERDRAAVTLRDWLRDPIKTSTVGGFTEVYLRTLTAINDFNKGVGYSIPKLTLEQLEEKYPLNI